MSLIQRTFKLRAAARVVHSSRSPAFSTSTIRSALSENDRDHPNRSANIDKHKQDSVKQAESGSGEWKPELATKSEQDVQAEKTDMSIKEMQKMGEEKAQRGQKPA